MVNMGFVIGIEQQQQVKIGAEEYLTFDNRRVKRWELVPESLKLIESIRLGGKD